MVKQAKTFAIITGIVEILYFIISLITASQAASVAVNSMAGMDLDPTNAQQVEELATNIAQNSGGFVGMAVFSVILVIALIVLGIVTLIMFTKVAPNTKGRTLGFVGSIMCIAGFIFGGVPVLSTIVIIATAAILIIAGITVKDGPQNLSDNTKTF